MTNWMLMTAFFIGISIAVTSCKDDDNDSNNTQKQEQEEQEEASKFWSVVGQLVSVDDVTDEYQGKTFEPTIGLEDETNPLTRIVSVNDMQSAAQWFADLIDAKDINENTQSYNWSDPEIGTMSYTKGGTPENWATVDVDIKAVPHLKKIVYRVGGTGENGDVDGKAYYRFGDVISREVEVVFDQKKNNDRRQKVTEYWICVRPSFGLESKGDSHWVCVNTVSDKNYKYYLGSNKTDYWLPYALKYDKKNTQNFAEMLYAICFPDQWYENANNNHTDKFYGFSGVPIFGDFTKNKLQYHNNYFWKNVQKGWEKMNIAEKALNLPNMDKLEDIIKNDAIRLLYNGYHWIFLTSWTCKLYEAIYTNGTAKEELNMHHLEFKEPKKDMKDIKFDVRQMGQTFDNYAAFFGNDGKYRWAIRHATGKELAKNGKYDPQQQINGVEDVYRYYRDMVPTTDLQPDPEITEEPATWLREPVVGCIISKQGNFFSDKKSAIDVGEEPIAMVAYMGNYMRVENGLRWNGLAIALKDAAQGYERCFSDEGSKNILCTHGAADISQVSKIFYGLVDTQNMADHEDRHGHDAAGSVSFLDNASDEISEWFIPSTGQWCLAMQGMGYGNFVATNEQVNNEPVYRFEKTGKWLWDVAGAADCALQTNVAYMTSTERCTENKEGATGKAWMFYFNNQRSTFVDRDKTEEVKIRPFVAFYYNNGGTEDFE